MKITKTISELDYSADQWQLYSCTMNCDHVARELNDTLMFCVNNGLSRYDIQKLMGEVMYRHKDFGSLDSEPQYVLKDLLDQIF